MLVPDKKVDAQKQKIAISSIERTINSSIEAVNAFKDAFGSSSELRQAFTGAAELILARPGRVIVVGIGKSGHIARKVAATMSSTGTSAYYVHPAEASHGDLGMISDEDTVLCFSWSGESIELKPLLNYVSRFNIPLVAISSSVESSLAKIAIINIFLPKVSEACPHGLAPTTSSALQLIAGDALAIMLLEIKGFTPEMFHNYHPGGRLGAGLVRVVDAAQLQEKLPLVPLGSLMSDAIIIMTQLGRGVAVVVNDSSCLVGVITDGDLRRNMKNDLMSERVENVMNNSPKVIDRNALAANALKIMEELKINNLIVIDEVTKPIGIIYMHDLLRLGIV